MRKHFTMMKILRFVLLHTTRQVFSRLYVSLFSLMIRKIAFVYRTNMIMNAVCNRKLVLKTRIYRNTLVFLLLTVDFISRRED